MPDNQHRPLPSTRLRREMRNRRLPLSWAGGPIREKRQMAAETFAPQGPLGQHATPRPPPPGQLPPVPSQLRCLKVLLGMPRSRLEEGRRTGRDTVTSRCRLGGHRSTAPLVIRSRPVKTQAEVTRPSRARPLICPWSCFRRLLLRWPTVDRFGSHSRGRPTAVAVATEMHQGMSR